MAEAVAEHGVHGGKTELRNRTYQAWLEHRIEQLRRGDNTKDVLRRAAAIDANKRNMTPAEYKKASAEINAELADFDPDYVHQLERQLVEAKNGPRPEPARKTPEETPEATAARHAGETKALTALEQAVADERARQAKAAAEKPAAEPTIKPRRGAKKAPPEVLKREVGRSDATPGGGDRFDKPVRDVISRAKPEGDLVHTYLDAILKDPAVRARSPYAYRLAKILREVLPADLKVFTFENAAKHFKSIGYTVHNDPTGMYHISDRAIAINDHPSTPLTTTLLHEAVHPAEFHIMDRIEREGGPDPKEMQALRLINDEVNAQLEQNPGKRTPELNHYAEYAATDWHEFIATYSTEPALHEFTSSIKPSAEFVKAMRDLGYEASPNKTLWQHFVGWARKLLGMPEKSENFLDHIMRPMEDIIRQGARYNREQFGAPMTKDPVLRGIAGDMAQYMAPWFHGTGRDIDRLDVNRGDIGVHVGTLEQARQFGRAHEVAFDPKKSLRAEEPEHGGWANPKSAMAALEKAGLKIPEGYRRQILEWIAARAPSRGATRCRRSSVGCWGCCVALSSTKAMTASSTRTCTKATRRRTV